MAVSSCDCSIPTTTIVAFNPLSCSIARAVSSPRVLRPAKRPGGQEIKSLLHRLLRTIRAKWPETEIPGARDSHIAHPRFSTGRRGFMY
jgi:hypothetical protein